MIQSFCATIRCHILDRTRIVRFFADWDGFRALDIRRFPHFQVRKVNVGAGVYGWDLKPMDMRITDLQWSEGAHGSNGWRGVPSSAGDPWVLPHESVSIYRGANLGSILVGIEPKPEETYGPFFTDEETDGKVGSPLTELQPVLINHFLIEAMRAWATVAAEGDPSDI